jgi:two-component system, OmpR family, alkaline phosphatase synthesis response regulator PhoP
MRIVVSVRCSAPDRSIIGFTTSHASGTGRPGTTNGRTGDRRHKLMAHERILVIEDEEEILELLRYNLTKQGYRVVCASCGEDGLKAARTETPNLVLLDLMLPGVDGMEVCRRLKAEPALQAVPIVMLTAKGEEADVVAGLEIGADDYVTKPFSPRVLIARVRAALRRRAAVPVADNEAIRAHNILIHPGRHEVLIDAKPVELTATEFRVLHVLAQRPGWVFTRSQIAGLVHGEDFVVTDRSVDVQIVGLRKKLGSAGECIETVRGVGYRFKE